MKRAAASSILVAVILLAVAVLAEAQQAKRMPRIGYLSAAAPAVAAPLIEAFREGLRQLGYIEGKNILIEWRYAEGSTERLFFYHKHRCFFFLVKIYLRRNYSDANR